MARKRAEPAAEKLVPGQPNRADELRLNGLAAGRLASLAGIEAKELEGQTIASLAERLRWIVDPEWLLFRRVCGRVVKTDPVTGTQYPVPFATVRVLDTDCDFWGYFPPAWPLGWLFPVRCHTEELTRVVTDECGNFCVWIPRFELEWILRWRRERFCFEDVLVRPSLADLLERLAREALRRPPFPPQPNPPDPWELLSDVARRADVAALVGPGVQESVLASADGAAFGASAGPLAERLAGPAFVRGLEPPLPHTLKRRFTEVGHEALAEHVAGESTRLEGIDLERWHGPFLRCVDVWVREWEPIFEVPDVSFEVTQDVDGDGDDDVIYRSYFDISFGGAEPNVTLEASPIAVALPSPLCAPQPCDGDPSIQRIGLHPVHGAPAYFDEAAGFAVRPNKPRPGGLWNSAQASPSTAPFFGELQVYGCNHGEKAAFYRVLGAQVPGATGLTPPGPFGPSLPIFASWKVARWAPGFQQHTVSPDASGWYPILDDADDWQPEHLLLDWQPGGAAVWELTLELGDAGKNVVHAAAPLRVVVDDEAPAPSFPGSVFRWRTASSGWTDLAAGCPLIERTTNEDVVIEIGAAVTAKHLRSVRLTAGGCGLTLHTTTEPAGGHDPVAEHWHTGPTDNAWSTVATYRVPGNARPGCYTFTLEAYSRAFNPAGGDGGFAADWNYDSPWVPHVAPSVAIAIVGP